MHIPSCLTLWNTNQRYCFLEINQSKSRKIDKGSARQHGEGGSLSQRLNVASGYTHLAEGYLPSAYLSNLKPTFNLFADYVLFTNSISFIFMRIITITF